jgi:hypothetical protein
MENGEWRMENGELGYENVLCTLTIAIDLKGGGFELLFFVNSIESRFNLDERIVR